MDKYRNLNIRCNEKVHHHFYSVYYQYKALYPEAHVQDFLDDLLKTKEMELRNQFKVI